MRHALLSAGDEGVAGEEGEHTMVKVLCNQRDRFREKANQLEVQLAQARCNCAAWLQTLAHRGSRRSPL